jgi:hypothetical protein
MSKSNGRLKGATSNSKDLEDTRRGLKTWLEQTFGRQFVDNANTVQIGVQGDSNSCGVCVLNAIEHAANPVHPLFTHGQRHAHRMRYFIAAMQYVHEEVSR